MKQRLDKYVTIFVEEGRECVALVVLTWPPEEHDDTQYHREEDVPERVVHPEVAPVDQALV